MYRDALWKGVIEDFFPELMAFFYPESAGLFDYTKIEFLDKELEQLFPEDTGTRRYADKLVKVPRLDGQELWLLVHIEVQGYADNAFARRMFQYFYRIFDRFGMPIEALALLTDSRPGFRPEAFEVRGLRTVQRYAFHPYKLLDQSPEALAEVDNPLGLALLTALEAIQSGKLPDASLLERKLQLFRKLLDRGYDKRTIARLANFIRYYVRFEDSEMDVTLGERMSALTTTDPSTMGIIETVIQELKKEAREEGFEKGIEQGIGKGIEQGFEQGFEQAIAQVLLKGLPEAEVAHLLSVPAEQVGKVAERLRQKGSLT